MAGELYGCGISDSNIHAHDNLGDSTGRVSMVSDL
jgi:hypothetical protein